MHSDDELYRLFLNGKTDAYDELMIRHGDSLTFYMQSILHDWHEAEDMMIEAFARIMVKRPRIGEGAFKAYLFRTGRNLAFRTRSKKAREIAFSLEDLASESSAEEYLESHLVEEEQKQILHLCMERIDAELREALWLIYFEDMSYVQAAEVMKVNTKRIDHLLTRGKKKLREELMKEGVHHV